MGAELRPRSCSPSYEGGEETADKRIAEPNGGGLDDIIKPEARYAPKD
jgi:hypothetical protein